MNRNCTCRGLRQLVKGQYRRVKPYIRYIAPICLICALLLLRFVKYKDSCFCTTRLKNTAKRFVQNTQQLVTDAFCKVYRIVKPKPAIAPHKSSSIQLKILPTSRSCCECDPKITSDPKANMIEMQDISETACKNMCAMKKLTDAVCKKLAEIQKAGKPNSKAIADLKCLSDTANKQMTEMKLISDTATKQMNEMQLISETAAKKITEIPTKPCVVPKKIAELQKFTDNAAKKLAEVEIFSDNAAKKIGQIPKPLDAKESKGTPLAEIAGKLSKKAQYGLKLTQKAKPKEIVRGAVGNILRNAENSCSCINKKDVCLNKK